MPTAYIKKLAKKGFGSVKELEKKWEKAKKIASEEGHKDDYAYIMGIFKRMLGIKSESVDETILEALIESVDPNLIPDKGKKAYEIFVGRFQPLHKGHVSIIKKMKNPYVFIVRGSKSDKKKNPFDEATQLAMFDTVFGSKVNVIIIPNGYLVDPALELRQRGLEPITVYAGKDRIEGYKKQFERFNKQLEDYPSKQFDIIFRETPRITSATEVRKALADDDFEKYKKLMPKELWDFYDVLKEQINKVK